MSEKTVHIKFILDLEGLNARERRAYKHHFNAFLNKQKSKESETYLTTYVLDRGLWLLHKDANVRVAAPIDSVIFSSQQPIVVQDALGVILSKSLFESSDGENYVVILSDSLNHNGLYYNTMEIEKFVAYYIDKEAYHFYALGMDDDISERANAIGIRSWYKLKQVTVDEAYTFDIPSFIRKKK